MLALKKANKMKIRFNKIRFKWNKMTIHFKIKHH